jgi:predicted MFS family arabinose efflux permease
VSFYKNVRYFYIQTFFSSLICAYVIERLFALERGMTVRMVVYCEIIYAAVTIALELPSGALADRFGRKPLLVFGSVFSVLEFLVLPFARGFLLFGVSALVAGIGGACKSGAWNALLYDTLRAEGRQDSFERTLGRVKVFDFTAHLIAGFSGALLAQSFGFAFNYWLSAASMAAALILTCLLREPPKSGAPHDTAPGLREIARTAVRFFREHPEVFRLAAFSAAVAACVIYVDEFWQNYLNEIAFPLALFGVLSAADMLVRAPGAILAAWLLRRMGHQAVVMTAAVLAAAGILWAAVAQSAWGIGGIIAACFAMEILEPVTAGYIHRRADPCARATIESAGAMLLRVLSIAVGLVFGTVADRISIFAGFRLVGVLAAAACGMFALWLFRDRTEKDNKE